ncbi:MAG: lysophospholipid acyltransferase family protein [Sandaracinus sp.]|nr:lysophospholipid acyltransferase family protein [Sandaracinus sp.]MCB9616892.1 lysophospholipid acyltransferase family protein [Sandaracinus sp.]
MKKAIGKAFLAITGWKGEGAPPDHGRYVLIAAPHTSNWDFPFTLAFAWAYGVEMRWMGKHTLFEGPKGWFFRAVGGVPVIRHERRSMVQQMVDLFTEHDRLALVVPAEGTRSLVPHWKSGFYHIARGANVPVVLGYLDYSRKTGGFGGLLEPTGDMRADMDRVRAFYADKVGKFPEKFGPIRLKEELEADEIAAAKLAS